MGGMEPAEVAAAAGGGAVQSPSSPTTLTPSAATAYSLERGSVLLPDHEHPMMVAFFSALLHDVKNDRSILGARLYQLAVVAFCLLFAQCNDKLGLSHDIYS